MTVPSRAEVEQVLVALADGSITAEEADGWATPFVVDESMHPERISRVHQAYHCTDRRTLSDGWLNFDVLPALRPNARDQRLLVPDGRSARCLRQKRTGSRDGCGPETRAALVAGAIEALREVAGRADCNQALVFYHFGSVTELLLAALDEVSARRLAAYADIVDQATGSAVHQALMGSPIALVLPAKELAHAVVAGFLGLELLASLDGDRAAALTLFDRARLIAGLLDLTGDQT